MQTIAHLIFDDDITHSHVILAKEAIYRSGTVMDFASRSYIITEEETDLRFNHQNFQEAL